MLRQDGSRQRHPLLNILACLVKLVRDGVARRFGQVGRINHVSDEITVTVLGWNTPRGSVRLAQVTGFGKHAHFVPNSGGAHIKFVTFHQAH